MPFFGNHRCTHHAVMISNKDRYREFCETGPLDIPVFMQYWWMETVCEGKQWDVAIACEGDKITGVMPFLYGRKFGMNYVLQPQLTQFSGPYYCYPEGLTHFQRLEFEKRTARKLLHQIDALRPSYVNIRFSPKVTNWLPFYWAGYKQTTRYTYRLEDISDTTRLFDGFERHERQRRIRRYEHVLSVRYDMQPSEFAEFHQRYWESKGQRDILKKDFIERVCRTAIDRGNGVIVSVYDEAGRLLVAGFAVYDSNCAHSLMAAFDVNLHQSGHSEILVWSLLKYLSGKTKAYDFEGSMDEGIEYYNRSFGTCQTPFFEITKSNSKLFDILLKLKQKTL